jgi:hypothetical protein
MFNEDKSQVEVVIALKELPERHTQALQRLGRDEWLHRCGTTAAWIATILEGAKLPLQDPKLRERAE